MLIAATVATQAAVATQVARRDAESARRMSDAYAASAEGCRHGTSGKTLVRFGAGASVASSSPAEKRMRAAELAAAFASSFGGGAGSPRLFARSGGVAATLNASMLEFALKDPDVRTSASSSSPYVPQIPSCGLPRFGGSTPPLGRGPSFARPPRIPPPPPPPPPPPHPPPSLPPSTRPSIWPKRTSKSKTLTTSMRACAAGDQRRGRLHRQAAHGARGSQSARGVRQRPAATARAVRAVAVGTRPTGDAATAARVATAGDAATAIVAARVAAINAAAAGDAAVAIVAATVAAAAVRGRLGHREMRVSDRTEADPMPKALLFPKRLRDDVWHLHLRWPALAARTAVTTAGAAAAPSTADDAAAAGAAVRGQEGELRGAYRDQAEPLQHPKME